MTTRHNESDSLIHRLRAENAALVLRLVQVDPDFVPPGWPQSVGALAAKRAATTAMLDMMEWREVTHRSGGTPFDSDH